MSYTSSQKFPQPIFYNDNTTITVSIQDVQRNQEPTTCRICLESEDWTTRRDTFVRPCDCKGSIAYIHSKCLKKAIVSAWKPETKAICCEICGMEYKMKINLKYRFIFSNFNKDQINSFISLIMFIIFAFGLLHLLSILIREILSTFRSESNGMVKVYVLGASFSFFGLILFKLLEIISNLTRESFLVLDSTWYIFNSDKQWLEKDRNLHSKLMQLQSSARFQGFGIN